MTEEEMQEHNACRVALDAACAVISVLLQKYLGVSEHIAGEICVEMVEKKVEQLNDARGYERRDKR
jgi:hypothetical protein